MCGVAPPPPRCRGRSGRCAPATLGYVAICRGRSGRCAPAALGYVALEMCCGAPPPRLAAEGAPGAARRPPSAPTAGTGSLSGYVAICRGRSVRCEPAALGYVAGGAVR